MVNGSELSSFDEDTLPRSFKYHGAVGAIQYLTWTRPETVFTVNQVCQFMYNPTTGCCTAFERVMMHIKGTITYGVLI